MKTTIMQQTNRGVAMQQTTKRVAAIVTAIGAALMMQGCGTGTGGQATGPSPIIPAVHVSGNIHGGQQPVKGATVQLYAVNTTTAKGLSTPLISATVLSDATGSFKISNLYHCATGDLVYITATGGDSSAGINTGLVLMAGLGPCSGLNSSTFISINELTTVATTYALAPFMADATHVGSTAATSQGLANAFNIEQELVSVAAGTVPGPLLPATATAPTAKLVTLADAMAACVNSPTGSTSCSSFYTAATPPGTSSTPADTVSALLNIVHYPANNVASVFGLITPGSPFQTPLAQAPADWTMPLTITGGGLNAPFGLAVDATGNVWAADEGGFAVSKFNYLGLDATGGSGYTGGGLLAPQGIAIDLGGHVWIANTGASTVVELDNNGNVLSNTGFTAGGIDAPTGIAVDKAGNAWVANFAGDSITELSPSGAAIDNSPGATGSAPLAIALDPDGNIWVDNNGTGTVGKYDATGHPAAGSPFTDGFLLGGTQIALTAADSAWVAAPGNNSLSAFQSNGSPLPPSPPVQGGGLNAPVTLAIDGANTIWVVNGVSSGTLSAFTSAGIALTSASGIGAINSPAGIAIDASGNLWTANSGDNTLTEFVGLASPVVTPLAAAIH